MAVLVDEPLWWWRGRRWCHLVSDVSLEELPRAPAAPASPPRFPGRPLRHPRGAPRPSCSPRVPSPYPAASCSAPTAGRATALAGSAPRLAGRADVRIVQPRRRHAELAAHRHESWRRRTSRGARRHRIEEIEESSHRSPSERPWPVPRRAAGRDAPTRAPLRGPPPIARPAQRRGWRRRDVIGILRAADHEAGAARHGCRPAGGPRRSRAFGVRRGEDTASTAGVLARQKGGKRARGPRGSRRSRWHRLGRVRGMVPPHARRAGGEACGEPYATGATRRAARSCRGARRRRSRLVVDLPGHL